MDFLPISNLVNELYVIRLTASGETRGEFEIGEC